MTFPPLTTMICMSPEFLSDCLSSGSKLFFLFNTIPQSISWPYLEISLIISDQTTHACGQICCTFLVVFYRMKRWNSQTNQLFQSCFFCHIFGRIVGKKIFQLRSLNPPSHREIWRQDKSDVKWLNWFFGWFPKIVTRYVRQNTGDSTSWSAVPTIVLCVRPNQP